MSVVVNFNFVNEILILKAFSNFFHHSRSAEPLKLKFFISKSLIIRIILSSPERRIDASGFKSQDQKGFGVV